MAGDRLTKDQRREQARREREEIARRMRTRAIRGRILTGVVIAVAAALVIVAFALPEETDEASTDEPQGVVKYQVPSQNHVEGTVAYAQSPPVGGDHAGTWLNCAAYPDPVPAENAVHSMEHGAAWVTYQPGLPAAEIQELESLAGDFVIVSPWPDLQAPVVVSSWGNQIELDGAGDERLIDALRALRLGPDTPELGAPCSGGVGTTS